MSQPPVHKYKHTFEVHGNSHDEIQRELLVHVNGGYLLDSDYETRDEFDVIGGSSRSTLEHTNPEMTPERYEKELDEWWRKRKEATDA